MCLNKDLLNYIYFNKTGYKIHLYNDLTDQYHIPSILWFCISFLNICLCTHKISKITTVIDSRANSLYLYGTDFGHWIKATSVHPREVPKPELFGWRTMLHQYGIKVEQWTKIVTFVTVLVILINNHVQLNSTVYLLTIKSSII